MSLRKSYLSGPIANRSFAFSKSFKDVDGDLILAGLASSDDGVDVSIDGSDSVFDGRSWSMLFPELLTDIIRRIESSEDRWPIRKNVVACACVCKSWREVTKRVVKSALESRNFTFPCCLKQMGPRDLPIQCLITRNKKDSTFHLYLSVPPSLTDKGKFLLAARKYRHGAHIEYIISFSADDISQISNNSCVGKICSDFLGTNFRIYDIDSRPLQSGTKPSRSWFGSKQISPQVVPTANFEIGHVTYNSNLLKSRVPRKLMCLMKGVNQNNLNKDDDHNTKMKKQETMTTSSSRYNNIVMKNKVPRWHEQTKCWCLNFQGRVTIASVKNFQLVMTMDQNQPGGGEPVVLQFGKVGEDTFTMDYKQPLSAFQAFAICLTSFGVKLTWK